MDYFVYFIVKNMESTFNFDMLFRSELNFLEFRRFIQEKDNEQLRLIYILNHICSNGERKTVKNNRYKQRINY